MPVKISITSLNDTYVRVDYGDYASIRGISKMTFNKNTGRGIWLSEDKSFISVDAGLFHITKIDTQLIAIIDTTATTPEEYYPILETILIS